MSNFKKIKLAEIHIPERLREVDQDYALAMRTSIEAHELLNPITVRRTPNAKKGTKPYTLVAGAHRLTAVQMLDWKEIPAIVVEVDALEATLIEIEENVFRNELSKLDRAFSIQSYRNVWEKKNGKIQKGNPNFTNSANIAQLISDEAGSGFSEIVADRLGMSKRSIENSYRIAKNIPADLREKLRGTEFADNQSVLLKFAKMEPKQRAKAAKAFDICKGDIAKMFDALDTSKAKKQTPQQVLRDRLMDTWTRADKKAKAEFMTFAGLKFDEESK